MTDDSKKNDVLIIAEMANAHEGDPENARAIVTAAAEAGASAIKFQVFKAEELAIPAYKHFGLYEKLNMPKAAWADLVSLSHDKGLLVYCDIFGLDSAEMMNGLSVDGFMIHAADTSNVSLLKWAGSSGKSLLLSAGGSTWIELAEALAVLKMQGSSSISLMHGFQNFPTNLPSSYLQRILLYAEKLGVPVGFASHMAGDDPLATILPSWAVAAGAELVEVHLTLDRSKKGLDYFSSLEPSRFAEMVRFVRSIEPALGPRSMSLSEEEMKYRSVHKKCLVTVKDVKAGEQFTPENIGLRRIDEPPPGRPLDIGQALGRQSLNDVSAYSPLQLKDIKMNIAATLACRSESTRLYGKPMQLVGDKPIIQHLIDRLKQIKSITDIVLAISDSPSSKVYIDYADKMGLRYILGPEKDVLQRLILAGDLVHADIVVRITPDNPFIYWENIDEIIEKHIESNADLTVNEKLPLGTIMEILSIDALKRSHACGEDRHRSELCSLFISENPDLFSIRKIAPPVKLQRPEIRLTVDTPYDLILVRMLSQALQRENHLISIEEIIDYLDAHPGMSTINQTGENTLHLWK